MLENFYAVIMAGGGGTRLWPVSRLARPKQMVRLFGNRSMFQIAVDRLHGLFPPDRIYVVTVEDQAPLLRAQVPEIPKDNYLLEPSPRNTASVVGLAAIALQKRDSTAVMAVLTADHYIANIELFHTLLRTAYSVAGLENLVTLGIEPAYPATGYGYIHTGHKIGEYNDLPVFHALKFLEKPDEPTARKLFDSGQYTWNSGMFIWRADQIVVEFARQMPSLYAGLQNISRHWHTPQKQSTIARVWDGLKPISIDYGIMEGAENVAVIPAKGLGWSDVGSWESLYDLLPADQDGNILQTVNHIAMETKNTLVFSEGSQRLVATLGVENLVIVDTGDVLLVCTREQAQKVREVVAKLRESGSPLV